MLLSASVQFYKRDNDSRSVEKAHVRISYQLNERLKYCEVTFRCIHGEKNLVSRDSSGRIKVYWKSCDFLAITV